MEHIIVCDEGFEPPALQMIQEAGIQPAWIYGSGPWVVADRALSDEELAQIMEGSD